MGGCVVENIVLFFTASWVGRRVTDLVSFPLGCESKDDLYFSFSFWKRRSQAELTSLRELLEEQAAAGHPVTTAQMKSFSLAKQKDTAETFQLKIPPDAAARRRQSVLLLSKLFPLYGFVYLGR